MWCSWRKAIKTKTCSLRKYTASESVRKNNNNREVKKSMHSDKAQLPTVTHRVTITCQKHECTLEILNRHCLTLPIKTFNPRCQNPQVWELSSGDYMPGQVAEWPWWLKGGGHSMSWCSEFRILCIVFSHSCDTCIKHTKSSSGKDAQKLGISTIQCTVHYII